MGNKEQFLNKIKNKTYVCLDIGSSHMSKIEYALEAVERAKEVGADGIKFQLNLAAPNIDLPFDYFVKAFELGQKIGIDVTSSIFKNGERDHLDLVKEYLQLNPAFIKFAYSQKGDDLMIGICSARGTVAVVSSDVMTKYLVPKHDISLFCVPSYPVHYHIDFETIFDKFYGFSDHTLGIDQTTLAVVNGARWIEKHFKLDHPDIVCPDSFFAINPDQAKEMIFAIRERC